MGLSNFLGRAGHAADRVSTNVRYTVDNIVSEQDLSRKQKEAKIAELIGRSKAEFKHIMMHDRALALQRQEHHRPIKEQRIRIADAAIGILMLREASDELSGVETQLSLDHCVRLVDRASHKIQRLNPNANFADTSEVMVVDEDADEEAAVEELVQYYTSTVNDAFVDLYLEGYTFDECCEAVMEEALNAAKPLQRPDPVNFPDVVSSGDDIQAGLNAGAEHVNRQLAEMLGDGENAASRYKDQV